MTQGDRDALVAILTAAALALVIFAVIWSFTDWMLWG